MESTTTPSFKYDAFIAHARADRDVAIALHKGLKRMGRRWLQMQALNVFMDLQDLPPGESLPEKLAEAAQSSRYLVLLASPDSKDSWWVNREVELFLAADGEARKRVLLVTLDGSLGWDGELGRFDPEVTCLPSAVVGAFDAEPTRTDLSDLGDPADLDHTVGRFRQAVINVAAPIHGMEPAALETEESRAQTRRIRIRRATVAGLSVLALAASVFGFLAQERGRQSENRAESQEALANLQDRPALAMALAADANGPGSPGLFEARDALVEIRGAVDRPGPFIRNLYPATDGPVLAVDTDPMTGRFVTGHSAGRLRLWSSDERRLLASVGLDVQPSDVTFLNSPDVVVVLGTDLSVTEVLVVDFGPLLADPKESALITRLELPTQGFVGSVEVDSDSSKIAVALSDVTDCSRTERCGQFVVFSSDGEVIEQERIDNVVGVSHASWIPGEDRLLVAGGSPGDIVDVEERTLGIWGGGPLRLEDELRAHLLSVEVLEVDPLGRFAVSVAGGLFTEPEIYLWPLAQLDKPVRVPTGSIISVSDVAISPNGSRLAMSSAGDETSVAMWDVDGTSSGLEVRGPTILPVGSSGALDLSFISNVSLAVAGVDGTSRVIDLTFDGSGLGTDFVGPVLTQATTVAHSSRSKGMVAVGYDDGSVWITDGSDPDAEPARLRTRQTLPLPVSVLSFGGIDDSLLTIGHGLPTALLSTDDGSVDLGSGALAELSSTIEIHDMSDPGEPLLTDFEGAIQGLLTSAAVSPDGRSVAATSLGTNAGFNPAKVWNRDTGEELDIGIDGLLGGSVLFHPSRGTVIIGGDDGAISEISLDDGAAVTTAPGVNAQITHLAASANGRTLAAGARTGELLVWQDRSLGATPEIVQMAPIFDIEISDDGGTLVVGTSNTVESSLQLFDVDGQVRQLGSPISLRGFDLTDRQHIDLRSAQWSIENLEELAEALDIPTTEAQELLVRSGRSPRQLLSELETADVVKAVASGTSLAELEELTGLETVNLIDLLARIDGVIDGHVPRGIALTNGPSPSILVPLFEGGYRSIDILSAEAACSMALRYLTEPEKSQFDGDSYCLGAER